MLFLRCVLLAATAFFGRAAAEISDPSSTILQRDDSHSRVLTAITLRSELDRREVDFTPKHTCEHHYADRMHPPAILIFLNCNEFALDVSLLRGESARFATTSMNFKLPALALEDIESQLDDIECLNSTIVLKFADERVLTRARKGWDGLSEFIVVSSHPSCNGDGERAPYMYVFLIVPLLIQERLEVMKASLTGSRVSDIAYPPDRETVAFSAYRIEWKEAYTFTKVDFGMTSMSPSSQYSISGLRFHDSLRRRLRRRQAATSSTVSYPSAPTSTPNSESSMQNLNYSNTSQSIISIGEFTIGCKNCTIVGVLDITQGTFTVNSSATNEFDEAIQFIKDGFFNVAANGISAHIELDTSISLMESQTFTQNIVNLALPGFQVRVYYPVSLFCSMLLMLQYKMKTLILNEAYRSRRLLP